MAFESKSDSKPDSISLSSTFANWNEFAEAFEEFCDQGFFPQTFRATSLIFFLNCPRITNYQGLSPLFGISDSRTIQKENQRGCTKSLWEKSLVAEFFKCFCKFIPVGKCRGQTNTIGLLSDLLSNAISEERKTYNMVLRRKKELNKTITYLTEITLWLFLRTFVGIATALPKSFVCFYCRITQTLEHMIDSVPVEQGGALQFSLPNIYVEVHQLAPQSDRNIVGVSSYHQQQTSLSSADQLNYTFTEAALLLPISLIEERKRLSGSEGLKLYFVVYHNSKLFKAKNATVNSKVIAASFPHQSVQNYDDPITLVFKPLQKMSMESISCTYWDPRLNNGKGEWSTAGCWLSPTESSQGNKIICQCNHLTNFAVLMDIYGQDAPIDATHKYYLDLITYIGCALSILGLSMTILTFLLFSKWRKKDSNKIVFNLALALLLLLIVFLAGIEQTHSTAICQAVAILLHYFILASFCWMLVEAIQQYLLFVRIFATYIPRFLLKTMLFAWGLPFLIVVIVIGIDITQYSGGQHYCWMKLDALYYAFLLPVGIIMIINAVVFILVLRGIFCSRKSNLRSNQSRQRLMRTQLFASICIFVLLGLTWVFGFLAIDEAKHTFQYIFCICNSLQGLLIFVFMVVRDRNAHDLWSSLCAAKKTKRLGTTSGLQTTTRREEANMSENFTTKLMISRTSTHSPP